MLVEQRYGGVCTRVQSGEIVVELADFWKCLLQTFGLICWRAGRSPFEVGKVKCRTRGWQENNSKEKKLIPIWVLSAYRHMVQAFVLVSVLLIGST